MAQPHPGKSSTSSGLVRSGLVAGGHRGSTLRWSAIVLAQNLCTSWGNSFGTCGGPALGQGGRENGPKSDGRRGGTSRIRPILPGIGHHWPISTKPGSKSPILGPESTLVGRVRPTLAQVRFDLASFGPDLARNWRHLPAFEFDHSWSDFAEFRPSPGFAFVGLKMGSGRCGVGGAGPCIATSSSASYSSGDVAPRCLDQTSGLPRTPPIKGLLCRAPSDDRPDVQSRRAFGNSA